jgi:DNA-binding transcriptional LysR family regulator
MQVERPIDMQFLQIFVAVAEERNMSNAARRLGITQSAVSQCIRQLESQFGVLLFNRDRRPLLLTPAGLALRNRGQSLLSDSSRLKAAVVEASRGIKPDLRVGLVDSFASTFGAGFIHRLLELSSTLSVRSGLSPHHGEALLARDFDVIVTSDAMEDLDGMARRRLMSEQFLVITAKSHDTPLHTIRDLNKLAQTQPIVKFNRQSHLGIQIDRFLRRIDARVPHRLELDQADTVTSIVAAGIGWAITTPLCLLQGAIHANKVKIHILKGNPGARSLYLMSRRDEYEQTFARCYRIAHDLLKEELAGRLDALHPALGGLVSVDSEELPESP